MKKTKGVKKFQIQISKSKGFKKILITKTVKKVRFTLKNKKLAKQNKLYARARVVKVINKVNVYGNWSKPKKVKIKK